MGYLEDVRMVASTHAEELRGDLDQARHLLHRSRGEVTTLEREVAVLESLLELASGSDAASDSPDLTLHAAMAAVLEEQPQGMLRAADLAREIERKGLYRMRDGRPVEAQQIHARVGHYPHLFAREGTFIKLAN